MRHSPLVGLVSYAFVVSLVIGANVVACSSDDGDAPASAPPAAPANTPKDALNAARGSLGGACDADADCPSGLRCIGPTGYEYGAKYCAPTCNVPADCEAFAKTSYAISVPLDPDGFGPNQWNSTLLQRGVLCAETPDIGGTQKFCQFFCPENAAVTAEGNGCPCLPRHKFVKTADDKVVRCEWDDASQCSILQYPGHSNACDACNSKPFFDGCYPGNYKCALNRSFNGTCYDWPDVSSLDACISSATYDCDESCTAACVPNESGIDVGDSCSKLCCKPSKRPANQAPACHSGTPPPTNSSSSTSSTGGVVPDAGSSSSSSSSTGGFKPDGGDQ